MLVVAAEAAVLQSGLQNVRILDYFETRGILTASQVLTMVDPGGICWQIIGQVLNSSEHHASAKRLLELRLVSRGGKLTSGRERDRVGVDMIVRCLDNGSESGSHGQND